MKVTLLTQFFPPETFAGANRVAAMAAALGRSAAVTVVTLRPSYPDPALYPPPAEGPEAPSPGVRVLRTRTFVPHRSSWTVRALAELRMAFGLARVAVRRSTDVVLASSPGMFLGPAGLLVARLRRVPFVWDVRDLTWRFAREETAGRRAALPVAVLERVMWRIARSADLLVAATPGIAEELRARVAPDRVVLVVNSVDPAVLLSLDASAPPERQRPSVTYAGLVGHAQALGVLCDAARLLPGVDFHVAGGGPELAAVQARARELGLRNVRFHGYLRPGELARLYAESDVLFAQLRESSLHTATALPSKLFEYMAACRPIVYAGNGLAVDTIAEIGCGVGVAPGDPDAIAAAIRGLLADPAAAREMALRGRRFVERKPSRQDEMARLLLPALGPLVHLESRRAA